MYHPKMEVHSAAAGRITRTKVNMWKRFNKLKEGRGVDLVFLNVLCNKAQL